VRSALPAALTASLRRTARDEGATLFMCLLGSFAIALYQWSGQADMLIGSVSAGRGRPELERVVGYFLRMLLVRIDLRDDPTFRELLGRVRETLIGALCHDALPFQRMVQALAPPRDPARSPWLQVTLTIEPPMPAPGATWDLTEMDGGAPVCKFDLSVELEDRGETIGIRATYSRDLFEAATIAALLSAWSAVLERALIDPGQRVRELAGAD
jgi:non-ribosomal peptide synthetase component F